MIDLGERLLSHALVHESGCWLWQGAHDRDGYGFFRIGEKNEMAHRTSYRLFHGPIPDGFQIDHLCKQESCINPAHLEAVTPKENAYRSSAFQLWENRRAQTHCKHGHSLADCYVGYKGRQCKTCTKLREAERRPTRIRNRKAAA